MAGLATYWNVVDVIEFDRHAEPWVRVGYYRRAPGDKWPRWASQTTACFSLSEWDDHVLQDLEEAIKEARRHSEAT